MQRLHRDGELARWCRACWCFGAQQQHHQRDPQVPAADGSETATINVSNPGGGSTSFPVNIVGQQAGTVYILTPYALASAANPVISTDQIIAALGDPNSQAGGIVADGVATAIVVFATDSPQTVVFNSDNGATVIPYDPSLLTDSIYGDNASVPILPIQQGGAFYAIGLVRSGTSGFGSRTTVSVGGQSQGILTVSPPVVLVHGLWGDQSSLAYLGNYLTTQTPQFGLFPYLNQAICYSQFLAFDATSDVLPGSGTGCEVTSTAALDSYLQTLYASLDGQRFVGGSVELVGHSMGGLVARHYSTTGNYNSIHNRMQGAFRQIITIDTPESGSDLATWLDTVGYNRTLQIGITDNPNAYLLWAAVCKRKHEPRPADLLCREGPAACRRRTAASDGRCVLADPEWAQHLARRQTRTPFPMRRGTQLTRIFRTAAVPDRHCAPSSIMSSSQPIPTHSRRQISPVFSAPLIVMSL